MGFLILLIFGIGVVIWLRRRSSARQIEPSFCTNESWTTRLGRPVRTDAVFDAWTSGNLDTMLKAVDIPTNPIERHFLLLNIVKDTYRLRAAPDKRALLYRYAEQHIAEFDSLATALKKEFTGILPRVPTFQLFATVLTEDERYDEAVDVCRKALAFGLDDGTQAGFEGRIARILKKKAKVTRKSA